MPKLPPEIWLNIAQNLSQQELRRHIGLNRVFLNVVLDLQWKYMRFSTAHLSYHDLERLS